MDAGQRIARITLKTMRVDGFDHRANWVSKVRNVSKVGSQCHIDRHGMGFRTHRSVRY
jgi:hypothetical protein